MCWIGFLEIGLDRGRVQIEWGLVLIVRPQIKSLPHARTHDDDREPVEMGKAYGDFSCVREFVRLPGLGHCPQDEGPEVVNPFVMRMVDTLEAERKQQRQQ